MRKVLKAVAALGATFNPKILRQSNQEPITQSNGEQIFVNEVASVLPFFILMGIHLLQTSV